MDDVFELTITTPRTIWTVDEPIEITATLTYIGKKAEAGRDAERDGLRAAGQRWWDVNGP